jgi:transposase InsO family protein
VSSNFVSFTTMVENQFSKKIKKFYSNNGDEFIKLRPILDANGISNFTTTPHTTHQNATVERRHRYIVKTGMTLLHHASAPLPLIGHMSWSRQFILLIVSPLSYTHVKVPLKYYWDEFLTIIRCAYLVVNVTLGLFRIVQINFNLNPNLVSFWGTP